jgi:hypothetical protein
MLNISANLHKYQSSTLVGWFILLFTLLPFLLLCLYSVPLGDDFWYADAYRKYGMVGAQTFYYNDWSGRYTANFLISTVNPLSYGYLNLGFLHPLLLIAGTVYSLRLLINTTFDFYHISISRILTLSILLFFYLNYLPDIGESFYWMAAAYTYQVPVIFLFLYIALLFNLFSAKSTAVAALYLMLALICLFVILGCNEVIVVYVTILNAIIFTIMVFRNKGNLLKFVPILAATIVLSYLMLTADGNFARMDLFEKPPFHFLKSVFNSLFRSLFVLTFWIPTLALLLLAIPGISQIDISVSRYLSERNIKISTILMSAVFLLVGVAFIGFFPSIYTTRWIPQRAYTPIFISFVILFVFVFVILLKYFPILLQFNAAFSGSPKISVLLLSLLVITLSHNSNVMDAYSDITSGKASSYHNQVMKTYHQLQTTVEDSVYVKELQKRPMVLPIRWPERHNQLANTIWEDYFKIKHVELE